VVAMMVLVTFLDVELNGVNGMDNGVSLHAGHAHTVTRTDTDTRTHARALSFYLSL